MTAESTRSETSRERPSVAVVLLNWNCWPDTIECLESLFRMDYPAFEVIVCDNASTDGSRERFAQWASGELCVIPARRGTSPRPQTGSPRKFVSLTAAAALENRPGERRDITLIENPGNLGFAAGNNTGIRYALDRGFRYVWVLNADTAVDAGALDHLVARLESDPEAGMCGSLICYYDAPDIIQEAGGCAYYPLVGMARRLAADRPRAGHHDWRTLERKLGYLSAASCLVSREFLEAVGLMSDDYFLYAEEIDWATRARGKFKLLLAEDSIVYHKKGISTGSKAFDKGRSASSTYYLWRARRRFTQRFHRAGLPGLFTVGAVFWLERLVRGRFAEARALFAGLTNAPWPPSSEVAAGTSGKTPTV